jgi:hypothetical protein
VTSTGFARISSDLTNLLPASKHSQSKTLPESIRHKYLQLVDIE